MAKLLGRLHGAAPVCWSLVGGPTLGITVLRRCSFCAVSDAVLSAGTGAWERVPAVRARLFV